jgi:outer membrane lipoprotein-sorting protein
MKHIVRFYAGIIGFSILGSSGWLIVNSVSAQPPPSNAIQTQPQKSDAESLNLFLRAFRDFGEAKAIKTTSNLSMQAKTQGATIEIAAQIQAVAQKPNQFHADVTFGSGVNAAKRRYQIISDGKTVWIYRPGTQEYSVQTYTAFDKSSDSFLKGITSGIFLGLPADLSSSFSDENLAAIASDPVLVASMYREMGTQFRGYQKDKVGKTFAVYSIGGSKVSEQINLWVEPQTATFQQFQGSGQDKGSDFNIQETIIDRTANPKIEPNTFRFIVPKGAKQVKTLSISPF